MLILTRWKGETFWIGDDVKITILGNNDKVKIGIKAPPEVNIVREELLEDDDPRLANRYDKA